MTIQHPTLGSERHLSDNMSLSPLSSEDKYDMLKAKVKEMMKVNEKISKEYSRAKKKIRILTLERNVLLDNIARMSQAQLSSDDEGSSGSLDGNGSNLDVYDVGPQHLPSTQDLRRFQSQTTITRKQHVLPVQHQPAKGGSSSTVSSAPPKRSRIARTVTKTRRVQPVERDEQGRVKLPQQIGVLTVLSLGHIVTERDSFHNDRYIFPVGYKVQRTYPSMLDPNKNTTVISSIIDGGDGPQFRVEAADMPDKPIIANSATGAWTVVVRRSNEIRHREHSNSASGPDYYGFKHPTIAKLIQDLPGARLLKHYIWRNFEEMEPRAAKGVMAAAEKKRGNLEQMGNANRRAPAHPLPGVESQLIHQSSTLYKHEEEIEPLRTTLTMDNASEDEVDELGSDAEL